MAYEHRCPSRVIARLQRLSPQTPELRESLSALIRYYSANAARMRYDEYLRLGYGIGSGAVESAHKQVVHARLRQAGMRRLPSVASCLPATDRIGAGAKSAHAGSWLCASCC
jgi:hypothetical protein